MNNKCSFTTHLHSWMSSIVRKGSLCHFCGITVYRAGIIRPHHTAAKTSASQVNSTDGLYILGREVWCQDGIGKDTTGAKNKKTTFSYPNTSGHWLRNLSHRNARLKINSMDVLSGMAHAEVADSTRSSQFFFYFAWWLTQGDLYKAYQRSSENSNEIRSKPPPARASFTKWTFLVTSGRN